MISLLTTVLVLTGVVWLSTEAVGAALHLPKRVTAMILGPLATGLAHGSTTFLSAVDHSFYGWGFVLFLGFVCTLGAKGLNDLAFNPLRKKFRETT